MQPSVLLNKVLQNDAEDLEAGINMAVTEMKTNQLEAAQQRLAKLREVYPDNTLIPELLTHAALARGAYLLRIGDVAVADDGYHPRWPCK